MKPARRASIGGAFDGAPMQHSVDRQVGVMLERRGGGKVEIADHRRCWRVALQHARTGGHGEISRDHHVRGAERHAHYVQRRVVIGDLHVRDHGAVLLRQPGIVERAHRLALEMRGHRQDRARGDDAAATNACEQSAPRLLGCRYLRQRKSGRQFVLARLPVRIGIRRTWRTGNGDEARTEALQARQIDVAACRIDPPFAAERGLHRLDRDAARLRRAVAAVLAHCFVDHDTLRRLGHLATLAATTLLGGAYLIVDQHRDAIVLAQLALHLVQISANVPRRAGRQRRGWWQAILFIRNHRDTRNAFRRDLCSVLRHGEAALGRLPAGHRDCVVDQQLVGDARLRGDRLADRHDARVGIRAVAHIGEHVRCIGEWGHANEWRALAAHVREGARLVAFIQRHEVAADAGGREATVGQARRCPMRTARAECWNAPQQANRAIRHALHRRIGHIQSCRAQEARHTGGDDFRRQFHQRR